MAARYPPAAPISRDCRRESRELHRINPRLAFLFLVEESPSRPPSGAGNTRAMRVLAATGESARFKPEYS